MAAVCRSQMGGGRKVIVEISIVDVTDARLTLCILDFGQFPDKDKLESMVKTAAALCHQGRDVACLVTYPVPIATQNYTAHLKHCWQIDEAMVKHSLDFRTEISIHYGLKEDRHEGDTRKLFERVRLAFSSKLATSCPWIECDIVRKGGTMENVPLCRVKDLRTKYMPEHGPVEGKLSPLERASQRGPEAIADILKKLFPGLQVDKTSKVIVIDFFCREGDWVDGVRLLQNEWEGDNKDNIPLPIAMAMFKKGLKQERCEEADEMKSQLQAKLLETVWEHHSEAGLMLR